MNTLLFGFLASLVAGLGTRLGALPAFLPISLTERVQGILLGIGGGAMLFVIVDEIIPEIDHKGHNQEGTLGVMVGFLTMMFLDITLG